MSAIASRGARSSIALLSMRGCRLMHTKLLRPWRTHRLTDNVAPSSAKSETTKTSQSPFGLRSPERSQDKSLISEKLAPISSASAVSVDNLSKDSTQKRRRPLKPLKAAITLTPAAVEHLKSLVDSPEPKLIRIGVRNRGCSGLTYNLEYVERPGKFDEEVKQDGVKVLIDSKALFSVIGSQMDWVDDKLSSRFVFNNPNSKGQCGCGESFMV